MNVKGQVLVDFIFQNSFKNSFSLKKKEIFNFLNICSYNTFHKILFIMLVAELTLSLVGILQSKQHITF